ncbi:MAG: hypothetical protein ABEH83_12740, partial [Halobacterium sp.]
HVLADVLLVEQQRLHAAKIATPALRTSFVRTEAPLSGGTRKENAWSVSGRCGASVGFGSVYDVGVM